jgi:hypothetical protein
MAGCLFRYEESEMSLKEKVGAVTSKCDFVDFVNNLRADLNAHPKEWENNTLDRFLEALSAWTQDMDGYYENHHFPVPTSPSWRDLAEMLLAAKYYE